MAARKKHLEVDITRELSQIDIDSLAKPGAIPRGEVIPRGEMQRIRGLHHAVARALVDGLRIVEVSAVTGYSPSRIEALQADPSFQMLMAFYQEKKEVAYVDMHKRIAALGEDAVAEIHERVVDTPQDISTNALIEIAKLALDRSGHGPMQRVQVSVMTPEMIAEMKAQAATLINGEVHTLTTLEQSNGHVETDPQPEGAEVGDTYDELPGRGEDEAPHDNGAEERPAVSEGRYSVVQEAGD